VGRRRRSSDLDGVLVLDKPAGPTSHDVVERVRRITGQARVGHTGTLDPPATGVLVLCLGRATKLVRFLQAGTKTYAARMALGVQTTTQDAEGEVVGTADASAVDERTLCEVLTRFQGEIEQVPPMVSAVKVGGERLHEKARRGEEVDRAARTVTVHDLMLDAFEPGERAEASFLITCSAGTYVRTLAHDVGTALGVGGSLLRLRRIANGPFTSDEAVTLEDLEAADDPRARLLTPEEAVARALPSVPVEDPDLARRCSHGGRITAQDVDGWYALTYGARLLGIYRDQDGQAVPELVWTRPEELS
jgi:tRNA pseudouridine55 synthase